MVAEVKAGASLAGYARAANPVAPLGARSQPRKSAPSRSAAAANAFHVTRRRRVRSASRQ